MSSMTQPVLQHDASNQQLQVGCTLAVLQALAETLC
jgi:hypothetical protein